MANEVVFRILNTRSRKLRATKTGNLEPKRGEYVNEHNNSLSGHSNVWN